MQYFPNRLTCHLEKYEPEKFIQNRANGCIFLPMSNPVNGKVTAILVSGIGCPALSFVIIAATPGHRSSRTATPKSFSFAINILVITYHTFASFFVIDRPTHPLTAKVNSSVSRLFAECNITAFHKLPVFR